MNQAEAVEALDRSQRLGTKCPCRGLGWWWIWALQPVTRHPGNGRADHVEMVWVRFKAPCICEPKE